MKLKRFRWFICRFAIHSIWTFNFYSFSATCNKWRAFIFRIYNLTVTIVLKICPITGHMHQCDDNIFIFRFFSSFDFGFSSSSSSTSVIREWNSLFIELRQLNEINKIYNRIGEMEREYFKEWYEMIREFYLIFANINTFYC